MIIFNFLSDSSSFTYPTLIWGTIAELLTLFNVNRENFGSKIRSEIQKIVNLPPRIGFQNGKNLIIVAENYFRFIQTAGE